MVESKNYQSVLSAVGEWLLELRLALIRDLAQTLQMELHTQRQHKPTLQKALAVCRRGITQRVLSNKTESIHLYNS